TGQWWILRSSDRVNNVFQFGTADDIITPADFTGDGKTDIAVWRAGTRQWFILRSEDYSYYIVPFGQQGDFPFAGDVDGDQKADQVIYRPSTGVWYANLSAGGTAIQQFGLSGDEPVPADYDGDGRLDFAIYRYSTDTFWISKSTGGVQTVILPNMRTGERPMMGDFTGDGRADCSINFTGVWQWVDSTTGVFTGVIFGSSTDVLVPGDYNGDGTTDFAYFRPSTNTWHIRPSGGGPDYTEQYGISTDRPVPRAFQP
ncbi:MAG: VCBS repeat-containing protein, partial [Pyrinomonadaceae bacterium]|nr:VCBS repeat-containing protein [Pyrinomonadaceae bacterium]